MRRFVDIIVASMALAALSPLLAVIMLAVFISSPGTPFYGGWRAGKDGRQFSMWKFQSMIDGAAKMGLITGKRDPRVTQLGRILRKAKLDELPQFFNLLLGDMTLVGPRAGIARDRRAVYAQPTCSTRGQARRYRKGTTG
jgi:lipopolysaccharide/colanic/teichoic acid biosynthesis glycosyltransferase